MTQELLHEMQEKFPIFILIAAGLLDLSGASRNGWDVSEILGLSFPAEGQPRAQSSPAPSQGLPFTEDGLEEVTLDFQSPAADPTNETTAGSIPAPTGRAANRTALLPGGLAGSLEVSEPLHTPPAALKLQDGHAAPGKLLSSLSIPVSTRGSQATTPLEQPDRSLQRKPGNIPGAGLQPFPSAGTHQDSPEPTAVPSLSGTSQMEVTRPKTSLLTPMVNFHPPGKETTASPFPTRVRSSGSAERGWLPTGFPPTTKRPRGTNPQAQPGSRAGVTPAHLKKTEVVDVGVTSSAFPPKAPSGDLAAAYSRTTRARDVQFSSLLSLKQETTGSKGRNSTSAVTNGSGHPTQMPVLHTIPPGHVYSSSVLVEAPVPDGLIPSPFQGPLSTTGGQQPLSLFRALNCTKHASQETSRSPQEITALALQRHTDHGMVTSKPGKSITPESPQASASSSSLSQSWISTLKLPQTTKELKGVTSAPSPGMSVFGNADLQPWDSVHEELQPPGASFPPQAGLQPMSIPSSAETGLHKPTTSSTPTGSGSWVQGVSAHPVPQEAFAVLLQVSTVEESKRRKSLPQQAGETGSPPASPVPSPSGPHDNRNQTVPSHSFVPPPSQTHQIGSLAASASELPSAHAQGSQSSSTTAHPDPVVPSVPAEVPAHLAQALVQQFRMSLAAATKNLSSVQGDLLPTLPSAPYLSFLLKSSNGMVCLQPMQESHLPTKFPNTSIGGLVSIQQILAASNSSMLDLASLQHLSPSSLVLVKPVFILLSTDRTDSQVVPFPQGQGDHKIAHLVSSVGTPESSPDIPGRTSSSYPTGKSETTLPTVSNQLGERTKGTSQPVPTNPSYPGLFQAVTSGSGHSLDPQMRVSPTVQALHLHRMTEEMQIPAPRAQEAKGAEWLSLDRVTAEPVTSPVPPSMVATQERPPTPHKVSFTTEKPHSSVAPLLPARALGDFPVPAQPLPTSTGTAVHVLHSEKFPLQTTHRGQGSVTTPTTDCSTSCSAGTTKHPLRVFTSPKPLQATSQRLPGTKLLLSPVVPSTSSASPVLPAGNENRDAALGSTARSGGVPGPAPAAQIHITSVQPDLPQHLESTPVVPKPLITTERPRAAPVQTLLSTEGQRRTTAPGELLATVAHPKVCSSSAAHPPSPVSARVPLLSALHQHQPQPAPAEPFSQASVGGITKAAETSTGAGKGGAGKFLGTSVALSATFHTRAQQSPTAAPGQKLVLNAVQLPVSPGSVSALQGPPKSTQATPQAPAAVTALSAAKEDYTTAALPTKKGLHLPTPAIQSDPNVVLPTVARVSTSALPLAPVGKAEGEAKGGTVPPSLLPTLAPVSASYQASARRPLEKGSLEDTVEQETGHSSPGSAVQAAGPPTTTALAVSAQRLVSKVTNQSAGFQKALVKDAEVLLARDLIQFLPSPESPSYPPGSLVALTPQGNSLLGVASTEPSGRLPLNTEAEEMGRTHEVTDGAAEGLGTVLTLLDSEPSAPSDSQQRRGLHPGVTVLNSLAVLSDDTCGSGNYTVQMSLSPAANTAPEPHGAPAPAQETFLALVALQSNSSQALLQIHSCCVTPSASPGAPGAQCCLFHRLPFECRHIQLLQSSRPRAASFTIQLFQMLNHSVAYLHCELNICLHGKPGCEQDCFENVEPLLQPSDRNSFGKLYNVISLGPVWRMNNRFLYKPVEGPGSALLLPILLGSLAGFAVLGSAFISLWLHHRQKTKPTHCPPFGEVQGL